MSLSEQDISTHSLRSYIQPDLRRAFVNPYIRTVRIADEASRKGSLPITAPLRDAVGDASDIVDMQSSISANEALAFLHTSEAVNIRDHGIDAPIEEHVIFARTIRKPVNNGQGLNS